MKKLILALLPIALLFPFFLQGQGCIEAPDDGTQIIGFIQPQYEYGFYGEDLKGESLDESSFYFKRARLGIVGSIPYDFSYYFMAEFSPELGGPFVLDAFVSYNRFAPYISAAVGQFKSPFGIELLTPCHKLHTINRATVVRNLVAPWRDFGMMFSGGTGDISILGSKTTNFFGYNLAILNGTGINVRDDNNQKDIVGRLTFHPWEFITLGGSYRYGEHPTIVDDAPNDQRKRLGFDAELKYKGFLVQGEYVQGADIGSYTTGGGCGDPLTVHQGSINRDGYFVQALYDTPWGFQPIIRYETYEPNSDVDVTGDQLSIITYGLNYFFNDRTRLQINYLYKVEENGNVEFPNDQLLVQMQIGF
jgi:phosphate-selective porin OprO/OprP